MNLSHLEPSPQDEDTDWRVSLLSIPFAFIVGILSTLWSSWVFQKIWGWYLVPAGVPDISQLTAIGIIILVTAPLAGLAVVLHHSGIKSKPIVNMLAMSAVWALVLFNAWFYKFVIFGMILN